MGRPALREAIKVLSGLGILESKQGSGTFLKSNGISHEFLPALVASGTTELSVLDLLEVRKILEPKAAWLAATRASERQLLDIEQARQRLEMRDRDWKVVAKLDYELHAAIFRGANNPVLQLMYEFLVSRILGNPAERLRFPPDLQAMHNGHKAIVEAILKRQADLAEKSMIDHLHSVGMNLIREANR
jgi:GntR family transcriptional repressor for pyruvate dehydrogenase complex